MRTRYYSLYECFEMLADTTVPELLAEFPEAEAVARRLATMDQLEAALTPAAPNPARVPATVE
jgi:hypothetical protein